MTEEVKLPDAIQRRVDAANEMVRNRGEQPSPQEEPAGKQEQPSNEREAQDAPVAAEPQAPQRKQDQDWEHRFKTYKAATDRTIYEQRQLNAELQAKVEQLTAQLAQMSEQVAQGQSAGAPALPDEVRERLTESFDEEDVEAVHRLIQHETERATVAMQQRIAQLEAMLERREQVAMEQESQAVKESFAERLDTAEPRWREIDSDPAFIAFLEEPDPLSLGRRRSELFREGYRNGDVAAVARHYRDFLESKGAGQDPRLAATVPRSQGTAPVGEAPEVKIWRKGEFNALVQDKLRGRLSEAEFKAREQEFFQAMAEGRVEV